MKLDPGSVFAGHRIESVAGRGGMGVVYRATHIALDIPVALKVIAPEMASDEAFRERFKRESRLAASIDHPNVISVRHAGEEEGVLYITMRFVDGTDLRTRIETRGRLESSAAAGIIEQVAAGLDAAHSRELIHRDVKPANILIEGRSSPLRAYLTDFGLTRKAASGSGLTRTGQWLGTLHYVAPEQIEGSTLDARADIYALGAVSYHCLAGQPPFDQDSDAALIYAHLSKTPKRLTERVADVPPGVADAIERAMAKDPQDRFSSAGEFAAALKGAAAEAPDGSGGRRLEETRLSTSKPETAETRAAGSRGVAATKLAGSGAAASQTRGSQPPSESTGGDGGRRTRFAAAGLAAFAAVIIVAVVLFAGGDDEPESSAVSAAPAAETGGGTQQAGSGGTPTRPAGRAFVDPPPIPVEGWPLGVALEDFRLVVATRRGGELRVLNKSTREPISQIRLPGRGEDIAIEGDVAFVTLPMKDAVALVSLGEGRTAGVISVEKQPRGVVSGGGFLWVANLVSGTLSRIDSEGSVSSLPLTEGAEPQDVAYSDGTLWVSDRTGNVVRVRPGGTPESFPVGRKPRGVAVVGRDVWVANTDDGTVTQLGNDGAVKDVIDVGGVPRGIAAGFSRVWVANGDGYVSAIDVEGGDVQRLEVGGAPEEVTVGSQLVWTTTGKGNSLVAIDPGGSSTP